MSSSPKNAKARKKDEVRFSLELLEKGKGQCDFATVIAETRDELSHRESEEKNRSTLYRTKERFNQKEFKQIMESGEVAYTKKCKELQVYPSVKIAKQLRTDTLNVEGYGIEDMHAVALAEAIKVNSNLTAIDLSDNQIGQRGCAVIAHALRGNDFISKLSFNENKIASGGAIHLSASELEEFRKSGKIQLKSGGKYNDPWYLREQWLIDELWNTKASRDSGQKKETKGLKVVVSMYSIAMTLKVSQNLEFLSLGNSEIGDLAVIELMEGLKENSSLTALDLRGCRISAKGAVAIKDVLRVNTKLEELDLSWNQLGDHGFKHIALGVAENEGLTKLQIAWNAIKGEPVLSVPDNEKIDVWSLIFRSDLKVLNLASNKIRNNSVWTTIIEEIKSSKLKALCLTDNPIRPVMAKHLWEVAKGQIVVNEKVKEAKDLSRIVKYLVKYSHPTMIHFEFKDLEWFVRDFEINGDKDAEASERNERLKEIAKKAQAEAKKASGKKKKKKKKK